MQIAECKMQNRKDIETELQERFLNFAVRRIPQEISDLPDECNIRHSGLDPESRFFSGFPPSGE